MRLRRRYHFHVPLLVYIFITLLIALGAFNSQNNLLFWAFGFCLAILLVSGFISGQMMMGLRVQREHPGSAMVGAPLTIRYRLTNQSRLMPIFAVSLIESDTKPSRDQTAPRATLASKPLAFVVHAGPRQSVRAEAVATPATRGRLALSGIVAETSFPFGIIRKSVLTDDARSVIVRPERLPFLPDSLVRGLGEQVGLSPRRPRSGMGEEFFALREYRPGDAPRDIAWRPSARSGSDSLLVRQHATPSPRRMWVVLRLEPRDEPVSIERSLRLAGEVLRIGHEQGFEVGLSIPATSLDRRPRRGERHLGNLLDDLALVDADVLLESQPFPAVAAAARAVCVVIHAGTAARSFGPAHAIHFSASDPSISEPPSPSVAGSASLLRPSRQRAGRARATS
ncbi:MAG: DUF58 domain-containing protein [Phycisphaerales bacterium]|nr:DUF58 domain-containing protein [Phycisphaerales bacterium]